MAAIRVTMEVGADSVALITICNPPVNALHPRIFEGLNEKYTEAMARDDVNAIVLTGAGGIFCGGFDINMFAQVRKTGNMSVLPSSVDLVSNIMEGGKKPSVAAIQGLALGGGLELTMACHARLSTPESQLGLPELTLGIIPGSGASSKACRSAQSNRNDAVFSINPHTILRQSKFITAKDAKECGLVDAICSPDELMKKSRLWALEIANCRKPWIRSLARTDRLGSLSEARAVLIWQDSK